MGTIKQGILGGFSGKVGGVIGTSWKGIAVMKAMPQSVANPRTSGQVAQRTKFKAAQMLADGVKIAIIKPQFDRFAQKMSGFNRFMQINVPKFDSTGEPQWGELIFSTGNIGVVSMESASISIGSANISIHWDETVIPSNSLPTDQYVGIVCRKRPGRPNRSYASLPVNHSAGIVTAMLEDVAEVGDEYYCYIVSRRADGTAVSETAFIEATLIP
jgi:hypothetical protein